MFRTWFAILLCCIFGFPQLYGQADSAMQKLKQLPEKVLSKISLSHSIMDTISKQPEKTMRNTVAKIDQYGYRLANYLKPGDSVIHQIKNVPAKYIAKVDSKIDDRSKKITDNVKTIEDIPEKYIKKVDKKIDQYSNRLTSKTEKTLKKLSRWEEKIHKMLIRVNPMAAEQLFSSIQVTFSSLLRQIQEGKEVNKKYHAQYDAYKDKLNTSLIYLDQQKDKIRPELVKSVEHASMKMNDLTQNLDNSEAVQKLIKERRKQLMDAVVQYLGKSKYLEKIAKEEWYYVETIKNYKQIFSTPEKIEETAFKILNRTTAFKKFSSENSQIASLFGFSRRSFEESDMSKSVEGLQTRSGVQEFIQERSGGNNSAIKKIVSDNVQQGQGELSKLKEKIKNLNVNNSEVAMPDFRPNTQKTKTFIQRLEYGTNIQFGKSTTYLPGTSEISATLGYKLNDKSIVGIGFAYRMGFGTIQKIQISNQGVGFRGYIDWKLKRQFYITGGFEMNYNSQFKNIQQIASSKIWQESCLLGITKKINIKTKLVKGTNVQILYDFLGYLNIHKTQPLIFRVGYKF